MERKKSEGFVKKVYVSENEGPRKERKTSCKMEGWGVRVNACKAC